MQKNDVGSLPRQTAQAAIDEIASPSQVAETLTPSQRFSAFIAAADRGDAEGLTQYIAGGQSVDEREDDSAKGLKKGYTAVSHAAFAGHVAAVKFLLEHGATVDGAVLTSAASNSDPEVTRLVLARGTQLSKAELTSAATNAAGSGYLENLRLLLEAGASPNPDPRKVEGITPLYLAAGHGHVPCVALLLKWRANPNTRTPYGDTPLIKAAYNGSYDVVKLLVESGASLTAKNKDGDNALGAAMALSHDPRTIAYLKAPKDFQAPRRSNASRLAGAVSCDVTAAKKLVTYSYQNKVYAINGTARTEAASQGWEDGFEQFNPTEMQELLGRGLARCN